MTVQRYEPIRRWFAARPAALRALRAAAWLLPLGFGFAYGALLARLGLRWAAAGAGDKAAAAAFLRTLLVPALTFGFGTLLRRALNCPRPYEQPGFVPLLDKETAGRSCPSRHALSAAVISMAWLAQVPAAGAVLLALTVCVCATRVLGGVHSVRDAAAGAALGAACGALCLL